MQQRLTLCFPGQGSQYVGMCKGFLSNALTKELAHKMLFQNTDMALGRAIGEQIRHAMLTSTDESALVPTQIAQPAIFLHSALAFEIFSLGRTMNQLNDDWLSPSLTIGHSVGEFASLYAAGALTFETALKLVRARGEIMSQECQAGGLLALFPLKTWEIAEEIAAETGCDVSSYNSPSQVVIGGTFENVAKAEALAKSRGIRRALRLPVSTAFHTTLMKPATDKFARELEAADIHPPGVRSSAKVISTVTGDLLELDVGTVRRTLIKQLDSPVRFGQAVMTAVDQGAHDFVGLGPAKSLKALISDNLGNHKQIAVSVFVEP
eukprot:TRINITY_DN4236_c0_g2_i1.p1 TRINITY_DN4236_c0_g2~~TRINITY_DN4236_c0_g2_i1.p1  ORF type:complete len:322 (+),score=82.29 TRINITY_DN4236_c0_g2_i1:13-978(+)